MRSRGIIIYSCPSYTFPARRRTSKSFRRSEPWQITRPWSVRFPSTHPRHIIDAWLAKVGYPCYGGSDLHGLLFAPVGEVRPASPLKVLTRDIYVTTPEIRSHRARRGPSTLANALQTCTRPTLLLARGAWEVGRDTIFVTLRCDAVSRRPFTLALRLPGLTRYCVVRSKLHTLAPEYRGTQGRI